MKYGAIENFQSGVSIPLSGLWSAESIGIGEYPDLVQLGKWASDTDLDLIQLLPINDTGDQPSPYSALSAFALNPAYLRLQSIPGSEVFAQELKEWQAQFSGPEHIDYPRTYRFKFDLLHRIFTSNQKL